MQTASAIFTKDVNGSLPNQWAKAMGEVREEQVGGSLSCGNDVTRCWGPEEIR